MKKTVLAILLLTVMLFACGCADKDEKLPVRVLIIPHFEIDKMEGDAPGEAQLFYEEYFKRCDVYTIADGTTLYYNPDNGAAMFLTGVGKANAAASTAAVLSDGRFDYSEAFILPVGCSGSSVGYTTLGDVILQSAMCDYDLGHTADARELKDPEKESVFFPSADYDECGCKKLNPETVERAYALTKDLKLKTTDISRRMLARNFPDEAWAMRDPAVMKGSSVTSDNYWKGVYNHEKAVQVTEYYQCADPFASTEMEDTALTSAIDRFGLLDRTVVLRVAVNIDVFYDGATPESLWSNNPDFINEVTDVNEETLDIFGPAMENLFRVGKVVIDSVLNGEF